MENTEKIQHIVPAPGLTGALELPPEPSKCVYNYIPEVTRSDKP